MANAQQETLVDFKTVRFSSVLGIVQNAGLNPANSTLIKKLWKQNFIKQQRSFLNF